MNGMMLFIQTIKKKNDISTVLLDNEANRSVYWQHNPYNYLDVDFFTIGETK